MQMREKVGKKVAKCSVFPMISDFARSKSKLAKAVCAEPSGQIKNEKLHANFGPLSKITMSTKCTPLWRETHFEIKM
jgi:hypothetical protein